MRARAALAAFLLLGAPARAAVDRDPALTPGVVNPAVSKAMVCRPRYTAGKDVRHVTLAMKREVFRRYRIPWSRHAHYEVDHLISLENFGANDIGNLWPQPYCRRGNNPVTSGCWGAREKDVVETALHRAVCAGKLTPEQDIAILRGDWHACYRALKRGKECSS